MNVKLSKEKKISSHSKTKLLNDKEFENIAKGKLENNNSNAK